MEASGEGAEVKGGSDEEAGVVMDGVGVGEIGVETLVL